MLSVLILTRNRLPLLRRALDALARQRGVRALYLLTTAAADFFARHGYVRIPRDTAPPVLQRTAEFAALCPTRAVCLTKALDAPPG